MPVKFKDPKPQETVPEQKKYEPPKTTLQKKPPRITAGEQAKAQTTIKHPDGSETEKQETLPGYTISDDPLCNVVFSLQRTCNMGDYNNLKFSVLLSMPCEKTKIDQAFHESKQWVEDRMGELSDEYLGADQKDQKDAS
jgi:hypothetical protein